MEAKPTAKESIELAKGFGEEAKKKTAELLAKPFTVHSRMQRALGDGRHERYYGFVVLSDGRDLGSVLVEAGLARTYGVYADGPGERSKDEYRESLSDLELKAARMGRGIWKSTDWEKLPGERGQQRREELENQEAMNGGKLREGESLNPNTAARDELMRLPMIGETLANRIIEAAEEQPFTKPEDLLRVQGLHKGTLEAIRPFLIFKK